MIVKHRYFSLRSEMAKVGSIKGARLKVIERAIKHINYNYHRPGEDRDKGQREFFSDERDKIAIDEIRQWVRDGGNSDVIHKLMLAPDINPDDMRELTRDVMKKMSSEKGLELRWVANVHTNTDNHHANVIVLGKDKNGRLVRFSKFDHTRFRHMGDEYLDRVHPMEREAKRKERRAREMDNRREDAFWRMIERDEFNYKKAVREAQRIVDKRTRDAAFERIREAKRLDELNKSRLPWLHRKILRELHEPWEKWKIKQLEKENQLKERQEAERLKQVEKEAKLKERQEAIWKSLEKIRERRKLETQRDESALDKKKEAESTEQQKPQSAADNLPRDEITHLGKSYSQDTELKDLLELDKTLREGPYKDRLAIDEYKKLWSWIGSKESAQKQHDQDKDLQLQPDSKSNQQVEKDKRQTEPVLDSKPADTAIEPKVTQPVTPKQKSDPNKIYYGNQVYTRESSIDDLVGLAKHISEYNEEARYLGLPKRSLPRDDYAKFSSWFEEKDRERMSKVVDNVIEREKARHHVKSVQATPPRGGGEVINHPGAFFNGVIVVHQTIKSALSLIPTDYGLGRDELLQAKGRAEDAYASKEEKWKEAHKENKVQTRLAVDLELKSIDEFRDKVKSMIDNRERIQRSKEDRRRFLFLTDMEELTRTRFEPYERTRLDRWDV